MRIDGRSLLAAWRLLRAARADPFASSAPELLPRLPGWSALDLPASELASARVVTVLDALRGMALLAREPTENAHSAQLVATVPIRDTTVTNTRDTLRVLITSASRELLVVGYSITDPDFRDILIRRAGAGIRITVVGDRKTGAARELRRHWPAHLPLTALEDVETPDDRRNIHAKVVVADQVRALIGSANFTVGGLGRNLEIGVRVEGSVAREVGELVELMWKRGWLEQVC